MRRNRRSLHHPGRRPIGLGGFAAIETGTFDGALDGVTLKLTRVFDDEFIFTERQLRYEGDRAILEGGVADRGVAARPPVRLEEKVGYGFSAGVKRGNERMFVAKDGVIPVILRNETNENLNVRIIFVRIVPPPYGREVKPNARVAPTISPSR